MTKPELIKAIRKGRAELEAALAGLEPEQMTAPGVVGEWSVKDLLGHIALWEAWLIAKLYAAEQDTTPPVIHSPAEVDQINAQGYAEQRDRPLDRVLADFHAVHAQLFKRLEAIQERDLTDAQRFPWMEGEPLEKLVANNTFGHYAEHCPALEAWRAQQR